MNITVVLLDGGQFEVENIKKDTLGKEIFKNACNKIGLGEEVDYFGLRFVNKKDGEFQWIDSERSLKAQLGKEATENVVHYLHFAVKFYPVNPTNIKQDLTRYQFVLQLRESLLNGRLECSMPIYALLASFVVQAEFGDHNAEEHHQKYLEDFKFCPNQAPELVDKIKDYHQRHKGMNPEQAELNFLDNVRKLPMYGVHRHLALDVNNEKVFIGVSNIGATVYRGSRLMSTFVWPKILSIGFKSKKFYIKIKPADEDDDFCKTSVGFKLSNRVAAKRLWKICVEHHTFFRLENVDMAEKKGLLARFSSPFRYKGKTENEIMKEELAPEEPFSRVSSKRFSERVLKSNRKDTEESTKPDKKTEEKSKEKKEKDKGKPQKDKEEQVDNIPTVTVSGVEGEVVKPSSVVEVESTPEVAIGETVPEIKIDEVSTDKEDGQKKDEEKEGENEDDKKDKEETKDHVPVSNEDQVIISNPLAQDDNMKSFSAVTTTTYTAQTSSGDQNNPDTSTVISSTQVVTTTKKEITTTTTSKKTLLESAQVVEDEPDIGLV